MSLVDGEARSATIVATTDLRVLVVDRAHFWRLLDENPGADEADPHDFVASRARPRTDATRDTPGAESDVSQAAPPSTEERRGVQRTAQMALWWLRPGVEGSRGIQRPSPSSPESPRGPRPGLEVLCAAVGSIWAECLWTEFRPAGALLQRSGEGNVVMDAVGRPANHPPTRVPATTPFSPIRSSTSKAAEPWQSRAGFGVGRDHGPSDSDD
jgi:hypothetical protein